MSLLSRYRDWLYPELRAFERPAERKAALARCSKGASSEGCLVWVLVIGGGLIWYLLWWSKTVWRVMSVLNSAGVPRAVGIPLLYLLFVLGIVALIATAVWVESGPVRKRLRALIREERESESTG